MTPRFSALFAAVACAAIASSATAQVREHYSLDGQRVVGETSVAVQDLDLSTPDGLRALLGRIETAADGVCGGGPADKGDYARQAYLTCRDRAVSDAVVRMKTPALTRLAAKDRGWSAAR